MITTDTSLVELAYIVCTALDQSGQKAVLTGGGAATVWALTAYQSKDLDFVFEFWTAFETDETPLKDLGFVRDLNLYRHKETPFTVEFPLGPLCISNDEVTQWTTLRENDRLLYILSPTDCVRDRLMWFYAYNDFSGLEQALAVATRNEIDLPFIELWSSKENEEAKLQTFRQRLLDQEPATS